MLIKGFCSSLIIFKRSINQLHTIIRPFNSVRMATDIQPNPLLERWSGFDGIPPFPLIQSHHFEPALELGMREHLDEITSIATDLHPPTFDNTIAPFDRAGALFEKVNSVFSNLCSSLCTDDLKSVQLKLSTVLAAHSSKICTFPGLFQRIDMIYGSRDKLGLSSEQLRLVERVHLDFVRAGARFDAASQKRYAFIVESIAELTTRFMQNVLEDESSFFITLTESDLDGLPDFVVASAKQAAIEKGQSDSYVITLSRSLVVPFLTYSDHRDLREKAWRAWTRRGELSEERDNKKIAVDILRMRAQQAKMHGYANYAEYATADTMAGAPDAVMDLLQRVWEPAKVSAGAECHSIEQHAKELLKEASPDTIEPWDWRYFAEKVRQSKYSMDETLLKPYLSLEHMCEAVFDCAYQLFGLRFVPRPDIPAYHPDVKVYEVFEEIESYSKSVAVEIDGNASDSNKAKKIKRYVGLFLHDNFMRPNKQSGAWMSSFRAQSRNADASMEHVYPIIVNNNNFAKGAEGEPTLLSFDDARTLFHEFGHGLHGMLSSVTYQRLSGTNVLRDFVELPSQLFEHWLSQKVVLKKHARHYKTNEPMPDELFDRLMAARNFNLGFDTVEYVSCALLDQAIHKLDEEQLKSLDFSDFEKKELAAINMPQGVAMRHRLPHFQHMFSSCYYASAYYVYLWAEVLDADGFDGFLETGDCFNREMARKVKQFIYSSGNSIEPRQAYRLFRGRDPVVEPMLRKKGLLVYQEK